MEFPSGTGEEEGRVWRFCINFHKVNATTHCDVYPLPRINETLDLQLYFPSIVQLLYPLTRKNAKGFDWTPQCQQAFDQLKQLLVSPPILAYLRFEIPFVVHADASDHAIGGVLSQIQDGKERVIAYFSRQLGKAQRNYSTIEREALAVVSAIQEFNPY